MGRRSGPAWSTTTTTWWSGRRGRWRTPGGRARSAWSRWLGELYGLDRLDAYQLLTQISASPIANVVDVNYSAVTKVPKQFLPAADAYGGLHRYLRGQAATL